MARSELAVWLASYRAALRAAVDQAARQGFRQVHALALDELDPRTFSRSARKHLQRYLRDLGLNMGGLALDFPGRGLAESSAAADRLELLRPTLELCRDLGASQASVTLGGFDAADTAPLAHEVLALVADQADRCGVTTAVRDPSGGLNRTPEPLRSLGCPHLRLAMDTAAMPAADAADLDLLSTVYLRDVRQQGARHEEVPFGAGDVDWDAWRARLVAAPLRPALVVRRDAAAGVDALRQGREYIEFLMSGSRSE
jgi:sugar phosphate isomerase/epimerase